ncbi:MAG: 3-hydroxyacyl-[acyl-carrier-protein] dehydratase FabZ [Alphaproteobacteria bacterium MarineAlpha3_Bin4]|nr:MAG: 3-hydroxyacyl-[acyl-carrier-protein] dehydratase FabZ [Alphaproteobacteria bacterium MarineAlpha3_Bin4]
MDTEVQDGTRVIEVDEIMQMIPHRYPFLLVDRVVDVIPNLRAVGIKNVSVNEPFFQGHFPGHPIMPGVLIVEAMAQTSAVLVIETRGKSAYSLVYFMTIDQARFRKPITPGDTVKIHVEKQRRRGNVWKFYGEARVDGSLMAEATYSAMIVDQ